MSERRALNLLTGAIAPRLPGVAVAEPLCPTPAPFSRRPTVAAARITVSSSYHVALTSLWLGVPAVLPRANGYYDERPMPCGGCSAFPPPPSPTPGRTPARRRVG